MHLMSFILKRSALAALFITASFTLTAQDATKPAPPVTSGNNQLAYLLIIMTVILAFVIWGMGRVLVELSRQVVERSKKTGTGAALLLLAGFSLLSVVANAQQASPAPVVVPNYGGLSETTFYLFVTVIGAEIFAILFMAFSIKRLYAELIPQKEKPVKQKSAFANWWSALDKKLFTKAVPVEKEADVMLDHNYDGIRELDNALPPWWKWGFYFTIVVGVIYLLNFHVFGLGKNPEEEYKIEMEKAMIAKELYESQNKDKIDEKNVPMADAAGIKIGESLFDANCIACHLKGGGGSVGPNLTDDYWIHKGSLNDIYNIIKNGKPDKGMQAWSNKFNPKEISQLASYIKSLRGTNPPNAKLPQGELYEETEVKPAVTDSAKTVIKDSAAAPVKK